MSWHRTFFTLHCAPPPRPACRAHVRGAIARIPPFHTSRANHAGGPALASLFVFLWAALRPLPCTKTPFCPFACFGEKQYRTAPKMAQPLTQSYFFAEARGTQPHRGCPWVPPRINTGYVSTTVFTRRYKQATPGTLLSTLARCFWQFAVHALNLQPGKVKKVETDFLTVWPCPLPPRPVPTTGLPQPCALQSFKSTL